MAQGYLFRARVTGAGPFPIDMLRYDSCYPNNESRDSVEIIMSMSRYGQDEPNKVRTIEVCKFVHGRDQAREPFTAARWASFGWKLHDVSRY